MTQSIELRSSVESVESIDTEDVLLPLLERLGIDIPTCLTNPSGANPEREGETVDGNEGGDGESNDDTDDELVYIVDRFGCVVIDDEDTNGKRGVTKVTEDNNDWRITSRTDNLPNSTAAGPSAGTVYLHKMPEAELKSLAMGMYRKYNTLIFDGALPDDMNISWNKKLTSTAGTLHCEKLHESNHARLSRFCSLSAQVSPTTNDPSIMQP